jgi:Ran GTPase-activating protein (RanGAP) involved in mRNA processing and transport
MHVIEINPKILKLNLSENNMGSEAGLALANLIGKNTMLKILILNGNPFGVYSCKLMLKGLRFNTQLTTLNLEET